MTKAETIRSGQASNVIPMGKTRSEPRSVPIGLHSKSAQPRVEVETADGAITLIKVTCACGQTMHLRCQYD